MPIIQVSKDENGQLQNIANILASSRKVVIITGAGISTNCGIPVSLQCFCSTPPINSCRIFDPRTVFTLSSSLSTTRLRPSPPRRPSNLFLIIMMLLRERRVLRRLYRRMLGEKISLTLGYGRIQQAQRSSIPSLHHCEKIFETRSNRQHLPIVSFGPFETAGNS